MAVLSCRLETKICISICITLSIDELGVAIMFLCGGVLFSPRLITVNVLVVHDPATGGL